MATLRMHVRPATVDEKAAIIKQMRTDNRSATAKYLARHGLAAPGVPLVVQHRLDSGWDHGMARGDVMATYASQASQAWTWWLWCSSG